jgi:hypothetical protein
MTLETMLDIFEELPRRVQTSMLSYGRVMKHRSARFTQDHPRVVAEYMQATGFYDITLGLALHEDRKEYVQMRLVKNAASAIFESNYSEFLKRGL